jgi:O-antigen ligase
MIRKFAVFESVFTVVALIHYSAGFLPLILSGGASQGDSFDYNSVDYLFNQLGFLAIYLTSFILLALRWKKVIYAVTQNKLISLLVGIACLSYLWSVEPSETLKQAVSLVASSAFGVYFATRYTLKEQVKLLWWMFAVVLFLSFLFSVIPPRYGIMTGIHEGAMRGIYTHKNIFGPFMALGASVFAIRATGCKDFNQSVIFWSLFILAAISIVLSQSSNGLLIFSALMALFFVCRVLRWRYDTMIPGALFLIMLFFGLSALALSNVDALLNVIGEDPTLTGRTVFWPYIIEMIEKRPWLGYGFSAFWLPDLSGPSAYIVRAALWPVPTAHNGFLDLLLDLGLLGLLVFLTGFLMVALQSTALFRSTKGTDAFWPLLYLAYLLIANMSESSLLGDNNITWVLYVSTAFSLSLRLRENLKSQKGASNELSTVV